MLGSAMVGAQYITGKAARDAFFLTHFDASSLPNMIIMTSIFSIVARRGWARKRLEARVTRDVGAGRICRSAILLIVEWRTDVARRRGWRRASSTFRSPASVRCSDPGSG